MRPVGEFLGLGVPGLAEGRPSVLLGDKVMLSDPCDPQGPVYEGYVHEVLKFKENMYFLYIHVEPFFMFFLYWPVCQEKV